MKVLVIEDHAGMAETIRAILGAAGYAVTLAPNGRVGTALARKSRFDMVLTDIMMPEQDGLETIRQLKELQPGLAVIAISGSGSSFGIDYLPAAASFGAAATLRKPFQPLELLQLMLQHAPDTGTAPAGGAQAEG